MTGRYLRRIFRPFDHDYRSWYNDQLSSGGVTIYAIIETGGKQYKVMPGKRIKVEALDIAEGETLELDRVLAISSGDKLVVGNPVIEGAKVCATSKGDGLSDKVYGMKYKAKTRYSRRIGHRQLFTELHIDRISGAGLESISKAETEKETSQEEGETENGS